MAVLFEIDLSKPSHYATLGVDAKDFSEEQLKKNFRLLALKWHPDRFALRARVGGRRPRRFKAVCRRRTRSDDSKQRRRRACDRSLLAATTDSRALRGSRRRRRRAADARAQRWAAARANRRAAAGGRRRRASAAGRARPTAQAAASRTRRRRRCRRIGGFSDPSFAAMGVRELNTRRSPPPAIDAGDIVAPRRVSSRRCSRAQNIARPRRPTPRSREELRLAAAAAVAAAKRTRHAAAAPALNAGPSAFAAAAARSRQATRRRTGTRDRRRFELRARTRTRTLAILVGNKLCSGGVGVDAEQQHRVQRGVGISCRRDHDGVRAPLRWRIFRARIQGQ